MLKKILPLLFFMSAAMVSAQTTLKWNALYWAVGLVNMSVETKISERWTINGDVVYSPWESINGNPMRFGQIIADGRYYPKGAFNGFYVGGYAGYHRLFKFTKWNYFNNGKYQKGNGLSLGGVVGYQVKVSDRWSIDVYAGFGWQDTNYQGYYSNGEKYIGHNGSGEWIPYKLGASFAYRL